MGIISSIISSVGKLTGGSSNKGSSSSNKGSSSSNKWSSSSNKGSSSSYNKGSSSSFGTFDKNKDYAAAIKNETDPIKRQQLEAERQNKINWLNATGQNKWGATNSIYGSGSSYNGYGANRDYAAEIAIKKAQNDMAAVQQLMQERQLKIDAMNAANQNKWNATNDIYSGWFQGDTTGNPSISFSKNWKDYTEGWDWNAEDLSRDDLQNRIDRIINSMQANSARYEYANNKEQLAAENKDYADQLARLGIQVEQLTPGSWYYMNHPIYNGDVYANTEDGQTGYYKLYDVPQINPFDNQYADRLMAQGGMYVAEQGSSLEDIFAENPFMDMADMQAESIDEQLKALQAQLELQKSQNNSYYDDIARQAYIAMRQGQSAMPQRLAAYGISGGASETAELGLNTNYQNNLNDNELARQQMLQDLDYQNLMAQVQANSDKTNVYAQAQKDAYNAYLQQQQLEQQQKQWEQEQNRWEWQQNQWQQEFDFQRQQYENSLRYQMDADEWERRQYDIDLALKMGDYQKLANMGYNTSYLQQMQNYELQQLAQEAMAASTRSSAGNTSSRASSRKSGSGTSNKSAYSNVSNNSTNGISSQSDTGVHNLQTLTQEYREIRDNTNLTEDEKTEMVRQLALEYRRNGWVSEKDYDTWAQLQGVATDLSYSMGSGLNGALKNTAYKLKNY